MSQRFGEHELIRLTDRDNTGVVNTAVLNQAIADACAEIDAYLRVRYVLPVTVASAMLVLIASDMARYFLYDDHAPEQIRLRYDDCRKRLKGIADGSIDPGIPSTGSNAPTTDTAMGFGGRTDWKGGSF